MIRLKRQKKPYLGNIILPVAIFIFIGGILLAGLLGAGERAEEEQYNTLKDAVRRAAIQCYAVEGFFPASSEYLEEHYGLQVNHGKYTVHYVAYGQNLMPDIDVFMMPSGG